MNESVIFTHKFGEFSIISNNTCYDYVFEFTDKGVLQYTVILTRYSCVEIPYGLSSDLDVTFKKI